MMPRQDIDSNMDICPYLGVQDDHQTCLAYPSRWNVCHRSRPASAVRQRYQRSACLAPKHTSCPLFQDKDAEPPAPLLRRRTRREAKG